MAKADRAATQSSAKPASAVLLAAVVLAAVSGGWAAFQWSELLAVHDGADPFCAFGKGSQCAQAWSSPFASQVQRLTGIPVAGWGLLWSIVALALPGAAWLLRRQGGSIEPWWSGTRLVALAGILVAMGLAALLFASGQVCANCLITHGLVLAYGVVCLTQGARLKAPVAGGALAAGVGALAFVALLVPGLRTPPAPGAAETVAALPDPERPAAGPRDSALRDYLENLPPDARQAIADALARWMASPARPVRAPRSLIGPASAPVRITEFADALCSHCANLHRTLSEIRRRVPPDSLAIEPRQFPLDGACNPQVEASAKDPIRCTAARALICFEGRPGAFDFATAIFGDQRRLDEGRIFAAAAPYLEADALRGCIEAPETQARLQADIDWAVERGIRGTPLVLVNGREATPLPPFLYALVLAGGDPSHDAFSVLPPPRG